MLANELIELADQVDKVVHRLGIGPLEIDCNKIKGDILCALIAEKATFSASKTAREASKLLGDKIQKAIGDHAGSIDGLTRTQE